MQEFLDRLQRRADDLGRDAEGLLSLAEDLQQVIGEAKQAARGQRELPGLGGDGEEIAGVVGLEARSFAELTKEVADLLADNKRLLECANAASEAAEQASQSLRTALHLVTDSSSLSSAKTVARRALDEDRAARAAEADK